MDPGRGRGGGRLKEFRNLPSLNRTGTKTSAACLKGIGGFPKLTALNLDGTKITEAGLDALGTAKNLKTLSLSGIKGSETGGGKLRKALPECRVES